MGVSLCVALSLGLHLPRGFSPRHHSEAVLVGVCYLGVVRGGLGWPWHQCWDERLLGNPLVFWPSCAGCVVLVQDLVLAYPHRSWAGHTCRHSCSSWTSVAMKFRARGRIWPLCLWSKGCLSPQSTGPCRLSKPTTTACTSVSVGGCRAQGMVIAKGRGMEEGPGQSASVEALGWSGKIWLVTFRSCSWEAQKSYGVKTSRAALTI